MDAAALTVADEFAEMTDLFAGVALGEGVAPLLLAVGTLLIVFSLGVLGYLTLGAIGSLLTRA